MMVVPFPRDSKIDVCSCLSNDDIHGRGEVARGMDHSNVSATRI